MPATAARAGFVLEEFRSFVWENPNVRSLYGKVARDTKDQPIPTFFDNMSSVEAVALERAALLGQHSRAFRVSVGQLMDLDADLAMQDALPGASIASDELSANFGCAVIAIDSYDTEADRTTLTLWGVCGTITGS
jgi:hypothetical protein